MSKYTLPSSKPARKRSDNAGNSGAGGKDDDDEESLYIVSQVRVWQAAIKLIEEP